MSGETAVIFSVPSRPSRSGSSSSSWEYPTLFLSKAKKDIPPPQVHYRYTFPPPTHDVFCNTKKYSNQPLVFRNLFILMELYSLRTAPARHGGGIVLSRLTIGAAAAPSFQSYQMYFIFFLNYLIIYSKYFKV